MDQQLTAKNVVEHLCEKLSKNGLVLIKRTKRLGFFKEKKLSGDESLAEMAKSYKRKKKSYTLLVQESVKHGQKTVRFEEVETVTPEEPELAYKPPTVLSSCRSAPDIGRRTGTPIESTYDVIEGPILVDTSNGSLHRSVSSHSFLSSSGKDSPFEFIDQPSPSGRAFDGRAEICGWSLSPPHFFSTIADEFEKASYEGKFDPLASDKPSSFRRVDRRKVDPEPSTPPTPANSLQPRTALSPLVRTKTLTLSRSAEHLSQKDFEPIPSPLKHGGPAPAKVKPSRDALTILRLYASDDGDFEGPCWTIAVTTHTVSREVCSIIEAQLDIKQNSLRVCIICAMASASSPRGGKVERQLGDEERMLQVRNEWLSEGQLPYFFLREQGTRLRVADSPSSPSQKTKVSQEPHQSDSDDEEEKWRARNTAILIDGHTLPRSSDGLESPACPSPDSEPFDSASLDSDSWTMDHKVERNINTQPSVTWINPGDIEKIHKVGDGSYAKVYKAKYKDSLVAVKMLKGVATSEQIANFKKEFEVLSLINSPYLMHFYGASIDEDKTGNPLLSIVSEYCEKGTLHKVLNNKRLDIDWQTCFKWIYEALQGLLYLHNMRPPMVHRDIKSHNLLLDAKWNIKVADFGLSRSLTMTNESSLGMLRGTLAYCAPELQNRILFGPKSDAYSMTIVMWEIINRCMTGKYQTPFYEYPEIYHDYQIIFLTGNQGARPTIPPKTPEALKELLQNGWEADPDKRLSCDEMLLQIQSIYVQYKTEKKSWESLREI